MNKLIKQNLIYYIEGILLSFSNIIFANKKWVGFCLFLLIATFPIKAFVVLSSLFIALSLSKLFNFDNQLAQTGTFTFNTVLVALGLSSRFSWSFDFLMLLLLFTTLSLFLSVWLFYYFSKKGLPFLVLPFLICMYILSINQQSYGHLNITTNISEDFFLLKDFINYFRINISNVFFDYFKILLSSLAAIFFIPSQFIGFCILVIIFFYSRINFLLVLLGFSIGVIFYLNFLGDFKELVFQTIGFNFILVALALGGFFIIPSTKVFLLQFFTVSFSCLLVGALNPLFIKVNSPLYSLPFVLVVLLFLTVLKYREKTNSIELVAFQQGSPEDNLYKNFYSKLRFKANTFFHVYLPIMGEWRMSQGIDGKVTHLGDWKHAFDFDIVDNNNKTYKNHGAFLKDYFAYEAPVIAPVSGYVVNILENIIDNPIGEINTLNNWGNSVVIKISDNFYLKISHLLNGSLKVKLDDYVYAGQIIGLCGNSGRSPEPHIHLQLQTSPEIGAKTIKYPFAYYLTKNENGQKFHSFDYPKKNEVVKNILPNNLLKNAFKFLPNHQIEWKVEKNKKIYYKKWFFGIDAYNKSYILDESTQAIAYFKNDGILFYFYDYFGSKNTELFQFYLAHQKVLLGVYKSVEVSDWIIPNFVIPKYLQWFFDCFAPFIQIVKAKYHNEIKEIDNEQNPSQIVLHSKIISSFFNYKRKYFQSKTIIFNDTIQSLNIQKNNQNINLSCLKISAIA